MRLSNALRLFSVRLLLAVACLALSSPVQAGERFEEMSTEDLVYVRGIISGVYPDDMQISVRPPKQDRVVITIGPDVLLEGVERIDELERKQQVKVWYRIDGDDHHAVKIEKMMDLGC